MNKINLFKETYCTLLADRMNSMNIIFPSKRTQLKLRVIERGNNASKYVGKQNK